MSEKNRLYVLTLPLFLDYVRVVAYVGENLHPSACREFLDWICDGHIVVAYVGLHLHPSAVTCLPILTIVSNLGYEYIRAISPFARLCHHDPSLLVLSLLSFRTFDRYLETLDTLFVDKFAYAHA